MKSSLCILILIFSYSYSIYYSDEQFKDIEFMIPTYFSINITITNTSNFKYTLEPGTEKIGLKFMRANLYTVNVRVYSSYEDKLNCTEYLLADNQFKEINVNGFNEVYIVIEQLNENYYYDDYLTIYDSKRTINLNDNEIIQINNFLSNNKYQFSYKFDDTKSISLMYSTQNNEKNQRKINISYDGNDEVIENNTYKGIFSFSDINKNLTVTVENIVTDGVDNAYENQGFSLIIHKIENSEYNFIEIKKNDVKKINYIYNNQTQDYYLYTNITGLKKSNTFNFKLNYKYFKNITHNFKVLSNVIDIEEEITQNILNNNIPTEEKFPVSYDSYSDEYYRIYISNISETDNTYQYLLVKIEIIEETYFYGGRTLEISIGEQEKIDDYSNLEQNKIKKIEMETKNYIPYYEQLILNSNQIYLLIVKNEDKFISEFIKGDLMINDKTINNDYIDNDNEIMVLSEMDEMTIRLFGRGKKNTFYIQSVNLSNLEYAENTRNDNQIFELNMKKDEVRYILGTYSYSDYAYGGLKRNYYATVQSGSFELFYKDNIDDINNMENKNIFPSNDKQKRKFDEIITLSTNLDLFTIKCISDGIMFIKPQYKKFNETTHLFKENSYDEIHMSDQSEIVQLSAPVEKNTDILYFSIIIVNSEALLTAIKNEELTLEISPDTEGAFDKGTIKKNQAFKASINLANYRPDQLAIHLKANDYGTDIEMVEVIHNNFTAYKEIKKGENKNINAVNVNFPISNTYETLFINISNLSGINMTYGIIRSPVNDANYLTRAEKYKNVIYEEINENNFNITLDNQYYHQDDKSKPYIYFVLSILGNEDDLNYEIIMDFKEDEKKTDSPTDKVTDDGNDDDDDTTKIIIIVVIIVVVILILTGVILFNVLSKKRRASSDIEKISEIEPN